MLLVFSGLPGTGKSTLVRKVARRLGAVYLRVDTVEAALLNTGHTGITIEGYAVEYAVAADNLSLGLRVVADCVNPIAETREAWAAVAQHAGARLVKFGCSDTAEHRYRVEQRYADVTAHSGRWSPPTWEAVQEWEYQPWQDEVLCVDTASSTTEQLAKHLLTIIRG